MHVFYRTVLPALLLSGASPAALAATSMDIAPHKAIYEIKMIAKGSGAQVVNIGGEMFFELKAGCEAWTTDHRFNLNYEYIDSPPMQITSDFTTYEPYAGHTLDFNARRMRDGVLFEELRGQAEVTADKEGMATYTVPSDLRFKLPAGAMFPMAHTAFMRDQIAAGKKFFSATVFDGSDDEGPSEINIFVGKDTTFTPPAESKDSIDKTLVSAPAHNLRMAFFPLAKGEAEAEYEMSTIFHMNGIISAMTVEYKEFTVSQTLKALQKLKPEACSGKNAAPAPVDEGTSKKR